MEASNNIGKFVQVRSTTCATSGKDLGADIKQCFNIGEDIHQRFGKRIGAQVAQLGGYFFHAGKALRGIAVPLT